MKSPECLSDRLYRVLLALSPNCKEASRLQSAALHEPMPFSRRIGLRLHLLLCNWCRRYGKNIRLLREVAEHSGEHEDCPSVLTREARERLRRKVFEKSNK
jgi:hypothetical protein